MIRLVQRRLIIPRGDTGSFSIPALPDVKTGDVAVFTIFDTLHNSIIYQKIVEELQDLVTVRFEHQDTVNLPVGDYYWDIKIYKNPVFIDEELVDGEEVDSYYAAYNLPECEIRLTGDSLLTADDSPSTTLSPKTIDFINASLNELQDLVQQIENGANYIPATKSTLGGIIVGDDLLVTEEGVLSVDKTDSFSADNTKPVTAAAVYTEIGNINALLQTI